MDAQMQTGGAAHPPEGLALGELVAFRPVREQDLPELWKLLMETPCEHRPRPWTLQRLKTLFENEKDPGLWGDRNRYFAITRRDQGELIGYLMQRQDENPRMYWNHFHIADAAQGRDELGADALLAYLAFMGKWYDPLRIGFKILETEERKAAWLEAAGCELELRVPNKVFFLGQPGAVCTYGWLGEHLRRNLEARQGKGA
jgi:RimJ/RimL family protein N-acetyltransferase